MHPRDLIELAGIIAAGGPARVRCRQPFADTGLLQYWTVSKCRLDSWMRALKSLPQTDSPDRTARVHEVLEEVLSAEVLTRIWTAVGCGCDAEMGVDEAAPILTNVWASHLDARHRVLALLVSGSGMQFDQVLAANRVRRLSERWTDLLLAQLVESCPAGRFAYSLRRLAQFAAETQRGTPNCHLVWEVRRASLRLSLQSSFTASAANPELNRQIAQSILACFHADSFDSTGLPKGVWALRLEQPREDTRGMLSGLLPSEPPIPLSRDMILRSRRR